MEIDTLDKEQRSKKQGLRLIKHGLRRSNSWCGDGRWGRHIARHMRDHLVYDTETLTFRRCLATGSSAVIIRETEQAMEEHGIPDDFPKLSNNEIENSVAVLQRQLSDMKNNALHAPALRPRRAAAEKFDENVRDACPSVVGRDLEKNIPNDCSCPPSSKHAEKEQVKQTALHKLQHAVRLCFQSVSFREWRVGATLSCVCCMAIIIVSILSDPVFRALFRVMEVSRTTPHTVCASVSAAEAVSRSGLVLPPWLFARWLDYDELSVGQPCQPRFPVVLQGVAEAGASAEALNAWITANVTTATCFKKLTESIGAVLLRGIPGASDADFENFMMQRLQIRSRPYTGSIGRRDLVHKGGVRTFTTRYPPGMILMPHIEFGNMKTRPEFIAFFAKRLPEKFGETPLVDFSKVWEQMELELKLKFAKGIRFTTRLYGDWPFQWIWGEYASTWRGAFGTDDMDEALRLCREMMGVSLCRRCLDGSLEYVMEFPALHFHARNPQAAVLSTTFGFWNAELPLMSLARFSYRIGLLARMKAYALMRVKFASTYFDPTPTRATFSDGTRMTISEAQHLVDLIWDSAVIFAPRPADFVLVDNRGIGHGRMNVAGRIEQRQIVSYIGGEYQVPDRISVSFEVQGALNANEGRSNPRGFGYD